MNRRTWTGDVALALLTMLSIAAFAWPFFADASLSVEHGMDAPWLFMLIVGLSAVVVLAEQGAGRLDAKSVAMLGVLSALGGAVRVVSAGTVSLEPMFFVVILTGRVLGRRLAFLAGSLCLLTGAFLTGRVGPWMPFQMIATGWVALGAALLPVVRGRAEVVLLSAYGLLAGLIYGLIMNLWFWPFLVAGAPPGAGFVPGADLSTNLAAYARFYLGTSLGFDLPRGLLSAALMLAVGRPLLVTLRRATRRARFDARAEFEPLSLPAGLSP